VHRQGERFAVLKPIGCAVNYDPWSGRRLSPEEVALFTRELSIYVGANKGGDLEDVQVVVGGANRGSA
jgi:hypothetical protein